MGDCIQSLSSIRGRNLKLSGGEQESNKGMLGGRKVQQVNARLKLGALLQAKGITHKKVKNADEERATADKGDNIVRLSLEIILSEKVSIDRVDDATE